MQSTFNTQTYPDCRPQSLLTHPAASPPKSFTYLCLRTRVSWSKTSRLLYPNAQTHIKPRWILSELVENRQIALPECPNTRQTPLTLHFTSLHCTTLHFTLVLNKKVRSVDIKQIRSGWKPSQRPVEIIQTRRVCMIAWSYTRRWIL